MLYISFTLLFMLISYSSEAEEICDINEPLTLEEEITIVGEVLAKDCSLESINKTYESGSNLRRFAKLKNKDLCRCLDGSKFMVAKVDNKRKKSFERGELDKTIADKMKEDFNNLASQFIMFENFSQTKTHLGNILDESEIKKAGGVCNIQTLEDDIVKLEKDKNCKAPKGFFRDRLKTVFGNSSPDNIWDVTKDKLSESNKNSCISKARYLDMRSSAGASDVGFNLLENHASIKDFRAEIDSMKPSKKNQVKDLLSYNVVFNMAYRDSTFFHEVKGRLAEIQKSGKRKYDLFQDPVLLQKAYTSMNRSCNLFSRAVKHYLCTDKNPTLHPSIMSAHLEDYFSKEKVSDAEKKANTDYFTWQYSCNPLAAKKIYRNGWDKIKGIFTESIPKDKKTPNEEAFERYVERSVMIKNVTKPTIDEKNSESDYAKFNKYFCNKDSLKINDSYAVSQRMSEYLKNLQSKGIDVSSVLSNKNLQNKLGLGIELEYSSVKFSVNDPEDIKNDKLPHVSPEKWEKVMAPELKKKGLSEDEIYQLYTLVEMQTNRTYSEVEDLKAKLVESDPKFEKYSLSQIKKHSEGFYGELTPEEKKDAEIIQNRVIAQKYDARMEVNYTKGLLLGDKTVQQVKNEAIAYNNNLGTFDNRYVTQNNEKTPDQNLIASTNSPKQNDYKFGSGEVPKGSEPVNSSLKNNQSPNNTISQPAIASNSASTNIKENNKSESLTNEPSQAQSQQIPQNSYPIASSFINSPPTNSFQDQAQINKPIERVTNRVDRSIASIRDDGNETDNFNPELDELKKSIEEEKRKIAEMRSNLNNPKTSTVPQNIPNQDQYFERPAQINDSAQNQLAQNNRSPIQNKSFSEDGEIESLSDETEKQDSKDSKGKTSKAVAGKASGSQAEDQGILGLEAGVGNGNFSPKTLGNLSSSMPDGFLTGDGTNESDEEIRKRLGLEDFQYPRYIPHKLLEADEIKTPEKLVMLMSLYGKQFKTIEVTNSSNDPNSALKEKKYYLRTFDFIADGNLEEYKNELETNASRNALVKRLEALNNPMSGHHAVEVARGTKEIKKEEITKTQADKLKSLTLKLVDAQKIYQEKSGNLKLLIKKYEEVEEKIKLRKKKTIK